MPLFKRRGETSAFGSRSVSTDQNQIANGKGNNNNNNDGNGNSGNELERLETSSEGSGGMGYDHEDEENDDNYDNPQWKRSNNNNNGPPKRLHNGTFAGVSSPAGGEKLSGFSGDASNNNKGKGPNGTNTGNGSRGGGSAAAAVSASSPNGSRPSDAATKQGNPAFRRTPPLELMRKRPINKTGMMGGGNDGGAFGNDGDEYGNKSNSNSDDDDAALRSFSESERSGVGPATNLSTSVIGGGKGYMTDATDQTKAYMSPTSTSLGDSMGRSMQSLRTQPGDYEENASLRREMRQRNNNNINNKDTDDDDEEEDEDDREGEEEEEEQEFVFKVVVVGDYSTGKTSLIKRFVDLCESPHGIQMHQEGGDGGGENDNDDDDEGDWEMNYESQVPTVGTDFFSCRIPNLLPGVHVRLQFWDTAGLERYATVYSTTYSHASAVMCVFDVTGRRSLHNVADKYIMDVLKYAPDLLMEEMLVVGNKMDLLLQNNGDANINNNNNNTKDDKSVFSLGASSSPSGPLDANGAPVNLDDVVSQDDVQKILLDPFPGVHFVETSAKSKLNVEKALKLLSLNVLSQKAPEAFTSSSSSSSQYGGRGSGREAREAFQMARGMLDMNTKHPFAFSKLPRTNTLAKVCEAFAQNNNNNKDEGKSHLTSQKKQQQQPAVVDKKGAAGVDQSPDPRRPTALPNKKENLTSKSSAVKAQNETEGKRTGDAGSSRNAGNEAAFHDLEKNNSYETSTNDFSPKENTCSPSEFDALQKNHHDPNNNNIKGDSIQSTSTSATAGSPSASSPKGKVDASVGLSCKAVGKSPTAKDSAAAAGKGGPNMYDLDALIDAATSSASAANKAAGDAKGGAGAGAGGAGNATLVNSTYDSQMKREEVKGDNGLTAKQRASKNLDVLLSKGGGKGGKGNKTGRDDGDMRSKYFRDDENDENDDNNNNNDDDENARRNSGGEDSNSDGDAFQRRIKDAFDEINTDAKRNVHHNPNFTANSAAAKASKANASVAAAAAAKANKKNAKQKGKKPVKGKGASKGKGKEKADGGACKCCTTM